MCLKISEPCFITYDFGRKTDGRRLLFCHEKVRARISSKQLTRNKIRKAKKNTSDLDPITRKSVGISRNERQLPVPLQGKIQDMIQVIDTRPFRARRNRSKQQLLEKAGTFPQMAMAYKMEFTSNNFSDKLLYINERLTC